MRANDQPKARMLMRFAARFVFCAALLAASVPAASAERGAPGSITDTSVHHRDQDLSVLLWLPYYYGYGFGVQIRYEFPVLPDGFIPTINDEVTLEPSFGIAGTSYPYQGEGYAIVNFTPALYGLWRFYFSKAFDAYFGLGLGINFGVVNRPYGGFYPTYFYWDPCIGLSYRFAPSVALRIQLGAQGFLGGLSFYF